MPDRKTRTHITEIITMLGEEFDRLNSVHFDSKLVHPKIEFSLRKSFGGYYQKREHRIVLSWQAYLEYGWDEVLNTFRHEVAHIVHMNHKPEFWRLAMKLGVIHKYAREPLKPRFSKILVYECPACHKQVRRRRAIKNSSCALCDKTYNPQFKLKLVETHVRLPVAPPTTISNTAAQQ